MTTYYKGTIMSDIRLTFEWLAYHNGDSLGVCLLENYNKNDLTLEDYKYLQTIYDSKESNIVMPIKNPNVIAIIDKVTSEFTVNFDTTYMSIIYEKIEDEGGNIFGKEIITGLYFPIYERKIVQRCYKVQTEKIYKSRPRIGLITEKELHIPIMDKCECVIFNGEVADNNEVTKYINQFAKGINRKSREKSFRSQVERIYNKNVFNREIIPKQKGVSVREKQSLETATMEEVEFILRQVSKIDREKYVEYQKKYESIISRDDFEVKDLASFLGELEYYLIFGKKNGADIVEYLEKLKTDCLQKIINEEIISLNIRDVDKLEELFLKMKNKYHALAQRKVLKNLSFIYLLVAYQNIKQINYDDLKNSYFIDNIKTILLIICSLSDLNIIENNIAIELNAEDINLENILYIINKIKFNTNVKDGLERLLQII